MRRGTRIVAFLFALLGAVGGLLGWKGNVTVREGSGFSNTLTQYDAWGGGRFVDADDLARSTIRCGLGRWTTEEEIDYAIGRVTETVARLRSMSSMA